MSLRAQSDKFFIAFCLLLALAVRLDFLLPNHFIIDADEAIVGLMAKHMIEGAPLPTFYYGQHYMGSFEPYLVSFLFRIFGPSNIALKAVPLFFSLALVLVCYRLGLELSGRTAARVAALLCALPPVALVVWSGKARGGFIELVFLGSYALLLCSRWLKQRSPALAETLAIGFVLGFGWWTNNQIVFFMLPIGAAMLLHLARNQSFSYGARFKATALHGTSGGLAFIFGGLPFWLYNIDHDFISFQMFRGAGKSDVLEHFEGLISTSIPIILGAKHFWETGDIFPHASLLAYSLSGIFLLVFALYHSRDLLALFRLRISGIALLPLFLVTTFTVFVLSSFGYLVQAPRYLLPAYTAIFLLQSFAIAGLRTFSPVLGYTLLIAALGFNLASCYVGGRAVPGEPIVYQWDRVSPDQKELEAFLEAHQYHTVRTNYWIGYRLAFETNERVRFLVFGEPHQTRIESYRTEGKAKDENLLPLLLSPNQTPLVESALGVLGYSYDKVRLSGYNLLHNIKLTQDQLQELDPSELKVHASHKDDVVQSLLDHDLRTRWGSGAPQAPGMQIVVEFPSEVALRGLSLNMGDWKTDYPRGLQIEVEASDGTRTVLLNEGQYNAARYYFSYDSELKLVFGPAKAQKLIFTQLGSDTLFDWSIAELTLYR